jgi:nicotinamide phosphoribosyltransferase
VIQGDGIDDESIGEILEMMRQQGWSADNIAFGSGGGLLQKLDRDTQRFAFKCSYAEVNGEGRDVFKRPATDPSKDSKRGRLKLVHDGLWQTVRESESGTDRLREVFRDGEVVQRTTLADVRELARHG